MVMDPETLRQLRSVSDQVGPMIDARLAALHGLRALWGLVTATSVGPPHSVSVKLQGASTATSGLRYLAGYSPVVNDVVLILVIHSDLVVLGPVAP